MNELSNKLGLDEPLQLSLTQMQENYFNRKISSFGGAIKLAGAVKARGDQRRAHSDWMKVERERGISIASSVMTYDYDSCVFNLLDTPGIRTLVGYIVL